MRPCEVSYHMPLFSLMHRIASARINHIELRGESMPKSSDFLSHLDHAIICRLFSRGRIRLVLTVCFLWCHFHGRQARADPGSIALDAKLAPSLEEFNGNRAGGAENAYKLGASVGAGLHYGLFGPLAAQIEILYATRGTDVNVDDRTIGSFYFTYLQVPVLARGAWRIPGLASGGHRSPLSVHLVAGGAVSRLLGAVREDGSGTQELNRSAMNSNDVSVIAGLGLTWDVTPHWAASFEVRYDMGFRDAFQDTSDGRETKNRAVLFTFGFSYTLNDGDSDGVAGSRDRCPDEAEYWNGSADSDGCADDDPDLDGIVGTKDACPGEAEDTNGYKDEDGCPDDDDDKDGILVKDDACPAQAFPYNKELAHERRGCPPDFDLVRVGRGELKLTHPLVFGYAKSDLTSEHAQTLNKVAVLLRDYYPGMQLLIAGHSDSKTGTGEGSQDNEWRSEQRAKVVRKYLVDIGGIDSTRLEIKAYGADNPKYVETAEGRQLLNRRVDLIVVANPEP